MSNVDGQHGGAATKPSFWLSLVRAGPFRIAFAFTLIVVVTSYVVFALVYAQFYTANVTLVRSVLQNEAREAATVPLARLRRQMELRLTQDLRHLDFVGLYAADGTMMFGNVTDGVRVATDGKAHIVHGVTPSPSWRKGDAIFVSIRRDDGVRLIIGRDLIFVDELEQAMLEGFVKAIIPIVLVALLAGIVVSRRASRRLTLIQQGIARVMEGDLHHRLPTRQRSDDIDQVLRAVNAMLDEIVRLLQQIKSVGDNIAHDLRAPLAVMRARLERGLASNSHDVLRDVTLDALTDLGKAMTTVTALLRISELESGLRRSAFDDVDLAFVCSDAFDLYEPLAEAKGVVMHLTLKTPPHVRGDGDLLREAVANLIDNAVKFTPSGGRVEVVCGVEDALISIRDTGPGVGDHEKEKIVKRFYRSSSASQTPGVGLGLSLATTIFELHGFTLAISDNLPGARFDVKAASPSL